MRQAVGDLFAGAIADAAPLKAAVDNAAVTLAETMQKIHGGQWSMIIDHERRAVIVFEDRSNTSGRVG